MLEIIKAPNPILSQKTKPVTKMDKATIRLIESMKVALDSAKDPIGVGLAAPQVGKRLNLFIIKPSAKSRIFTFINPEIIQKSALEKVTGKEHLRKLEGCLSLPDIWGDVQRFHRITVRYLDETGKQHKRKFRGFMSTVIQHEIDHLNGILFPKRVLEQSGTLYKSEKDEKGEDVFEELKI